MIKRIILSGVAALLLCATALGQPRQGGTLKFVVEPEPPTLVSIDNSFGATQKISSKISEGLLTCARSRSSPPSGRSARTGCAIRSVCALA